MKINLYDFDKTIYDGDSTVNFYFYILKKYPSTIKYLPITIIYFILYKLHLKTKTNFKEKFYLFLKVIPNIDKEVEIFWHNNKRKIKSFYLKKDHSNDIIISASPYFLLKPICESLEVKDLIASNVDKRTGTYTGINCHGTEKVRRLNEKYRDYQVIESYSDSYSDVPILKLAQEAYIIKKEELIKYK